MTPPPEPRTTAGRAYLEKLERDDAGMQKLSSGRFHLGAITADARTAVIAIEAEAADAPLREALERRMASGGWDAKTKAAYEWGFTDCAALTAKPAPAPLDEATCGHDSIAADCPICAVYGRATATEDTE